MDLTLSYTLLAAACTVFGVHAQSDTNKCHFKETCGDCIAQDPLCAWCSQEDYKEYGIPRCDYLPNLKGKCNDIVHPSDSVVKLKDMKLSDKGTKEEEAIQIKPQEIRIRVRPNSPITFPVQFRQAVDYPVDLYYVMDLSNSMADDKQKLAELGDKLAQDMGSITSNFRLGFGSFVDKVAAPYVNSHPDRLKMPCSNCAAPYGFLNNMPLSLKTKEFAKKVRASKVSGNLDGVEGGFDAIMQAVVCKKEIGWRNKSRKLLVLSTDNGFHYAGDGKMAGIVSPNDGNCHLDSKGYYTKTAEQDYPSLSQINRKIKESKVNIIFAVTRDQVELYKRLSKRLIGSSTGRLEADSSNVVRLIRNQYNKISSSVEMTDSLKDSSNVRITYESSCLGNRKQKTNFCTGLKVGTSVSFDVTLEVSFCPRNLFERNQTFEIYPVGLNEYLTVHLEIVCECDCEKPWKEERFSPKCNNGSGTYECGICTCYDYKYGQECECDQRENDPFVEETGCYQGNDSKPCSDQGVCRCGKCYCHKRSKPDEKIYGKFCECDNFSCDKKNGKFCNGADHGICDCGKCKCMKGWTGNDCGCSGSTDNCLDHNGKICSGHGKCVCGSCVCETSEQEYLGKFCDDCLTCPGKCAELKDCVECFIESLQDNQINRDKGNCSHCEFLVFPVDKIEIQEKEKLCTFEDDNNCQFSFKYKMDELNQPIVYVKKEKDCSPPVNILAIVSGVAGSVVGAGLLLLLMWKLLTTVHDRRELAKFEKERLKTKWDAGENPIYKQATSTFHNPVYGGD